MSHAGARRGAEARPAAARRADEPPRPRRHRAAEDRLPPVLRPRASSRVASTRHRVARAACPVGDGPRRSGRRLARPRGARESTRCAEMRRDAPRFAEIRRDSPRFAEGPERSREEPRIAEIRRGASSRPCRCSTHLLRSARSPHISPHLPASPARCSTASRRTSCTPRAATGSCTQAHISPHLPASPHTSPYLGHGEPYAGSYSTDFSCIRPHSVVCTCTRRSDDVGVSSPCRLVLGLSAPRRAAARGHGAAGERRLAGWRGGGRSALPNDMCP